MRDETEDPIDNNDRDLWPDIDTVDTDPPLDEATRIERNDIHECWRVLVAVGGTELRLSFDGHRDTSPRLKLTCLPFNGDPVHTLFLDQEQSQEVRRAFILLGRTLEAQASSLP